MNTKQLINLLLTPEGKDQISTFNKIMVTYQFKCYCDNSYICLTTRQLEKTVKEDITACLTNVLKI